MVIVMLYRDPGRFPGVKPGHVFRTFPLLFVLILTGVWGSAGDTLWADNAPRDWRAEWPNTDFSKSTVAFDDIISGGPPKDGIPAISDPLFADVGNADMSPKEPVIVVTHAGEARAYPLKILMWHEIVNDKIGDLPITVTYCPLCNTSVVFDRRIDGRDLDFGVSGKLLHSDMIMYDRQTESWWQQFTGAAIVGDMVGSKLTMLASRVWPYEKFADTYPTGSVLVPRHDQRRPYGANPYVGYDSSRTPFLYRGDFDKPIKPLAYVVAVEDQAWPLALLRKKGEISTASLVLRWQSGMASALDHEDIRKGRDIGFVEVIDKSNGSEQMVPFVTTFAFAFCAFHPEGTIHGIGRDASQAAP